MKQPGGHGRLSVASPKACILLTVPSIRLTKHGRIYIHSFNAEKHLINKRLSWGFRELYLLSPVKLALQQVLRSLLHIQGDNYCFGVQF